MMIENCKTFPSRDSNPGRVGENHVSWPARLLGIVYAPAGNQTRVSSVAGTYTITVLPAHMYSYRGALLVKLTKFKLVKKLCRHPESHRGYRRHKPGYCYYTIAAIEWRIRVSIPVLNLAKVVCYHVQQSPMSAFIGTRTRISTLEGLNTTLVLWTRTFKFGTRLWNQT